MSSIEADDGRIHSTHRVPKTALMISSSSDAERESNVSERGALHS